MIQQNTYRLIVMLIFEIEAGKQAVKSREFLLLGEFLLISSKSDTSNFSNKRMPA